MKCIWVTAALAGLLAAPAWANDESMAKTLGFYWQAAAGHMRLMAAARPVDELIADPATPAALKARLEKAQAIRRFASDALKLPSNRSYTAYADLRKSAVVWNVVAAPSMELKAKTWCFAVAGCVGYRGYHAEADALAEGELLKAQGYEVSVYPVPAYSTLGKLKWLGGDPLLNTFIGYPDWELARLIFHELAHQVLYVADDTVFNESFATAVERIGGRLWIEQHATREARAAFDERDQRSRQWREMLGRTRERLQEAFRPYETAVLKNNSHSAIESIGFAAIKNKALTDKAQTMQQLRDDYAELKKSWGGFAGYDAAMARTNNATLVASGAYDELVPQFEAVFSKVGADWPRFYDAVMALVPLPKDERRAKLKTLAGI